MRVLVVDDSRAMRMIIKRELRSVEGLDDILEADSAESAINVLTEEAVDLVLSDWNMPGMSGFEFLKLIRDAGWNGHFGFITSEAAESTRIQALEAGAAFLITKPFTGADLGYNISLLSSGGVNNAYEESAIKLSEEGPSVSSVLEGLLHREVTVTKADPPRREMARVLARYANAAGELAAACIAEITFAASAGAALSMVPPATASEWARSGTLTEMIAQNFYEVANVLAPVVNLGGPHVRLLDVMMLADFEKPPDAEKIANPTKQVNLNVVIEGYEPGRVALISLS